MATRASRNAKTIVSSLSEVRRSLPEFLRSVRKSGRDAEPIVFGSYRQAEAVVMPYEAYRAYLDYLDELAIARLIEERMKTPGRKHLSEDEFRERVGHASARTRTS